ncbi:hypothetical protein MGU_06206 [Metarhizium guizhouense ARSEF 977]|uniref:Uncharacterized protein n=1 Tax=Metarhizium guizhouense (strain ARSEF 977) TaxID=1276136 RepID=A0A0B4I2J9_METGA|nr:hypothetical protein MGU_06206 [Metarhizium guizhouense ARSEF 977]
MRPMVLAGLVGTILAIESPEECADRCTLAWYECKGIHGGRWPCDGEYTVCLGFNPFTRGYDVPIACRGKNKPFDPYAPPPPSPPPPPTPTVATDIHTQECIWAFKKCANKPDANKSTCRDKYHACLKHKSLKAIIEKRMMVDSETTEPSITEPSITEPPSPCAINDLECLGHSISSSPTENLGKTMTTDSETTAPPITKTSSACATDDVECSEHNPIPITTENLWETMTTDSETTEPPITKTPSLCATGDSDCSDHNPTPTPTTTETPQETTTAHSETMEPSVTSVPKGPSPCAGRCLRDYYSCLLVPNYNHCPTMLVQCLGYNPFYSGKLNLPIATCAQEPTSTSTTTSTRTPTPTATLVQDKCAKECTDTFNSCKRLPNSHEAVCGLYLIHCVGYNYFKEGLKVPTTCRTPTPTPTPTPTSPAGACAQNCLDEWNSCKKSTRKGRAHCKSAMTECLGYNPFKKGHKKPTACQRSAAPSPTAQPTQAARAKSCTDEWQACRSRPGADQSLCSFNFANCLGYAPFSNSTNSTLPVSCSRHIPANITTTAPFPFTNLTKAVSTTTAVTEFPMSTSFGSSSQTPVGTIWVPTTTMNLTATVTAAAGHLEPAMLLVVLAVALL